jgi:hypothetical protein
MSGVYLTIERFPNGDVVAHCHRSRFNVQGMTTGAGLKTFVR